MGKNKEYDISGGLSCIPNSKNMTQSTITLTPEDAKSTEDISQCQNNKDVLCGVGSWSPQWLQKLATPKAFLAVYSLCGIVQGAHFTYLVGCLSTMEKRFVYDSKISGLVMISDEIAPIVLGVIVGYFGGETNRPQLITIGMLIGSLSSFAMALPYFLYGSLEITAPHVSLADTGLKPNAEYCNSQYERAQGDCSTSTTVPAVSLFFFGNFLKGISGLIFYTIGTAYLDDNVKKKNSPFYLGTLFALRLLGPTLGFLLSSLCLQYYEDPFYDPGFGQKDPRWVGAWWMGFIILGVAIFICSIPMILFPRRFPSKSLPASLANKKKEEVTKETPIQQLKSMVKAMKRLGKNPILICHYLGGVLRLNGVVGYYVLLPKYMEMQFRQSASKASLYSGPASIIGMQIGILFGGIAIRKFKPRPRVLTGGILCAESFSVIALLSCMLITCPVYQLTGTTALENNRLNLENTCNKGCSCSTRVYTPVCGPDGTSTYFSPCFAGCSGFNKTDEKEVFTDCSCVHDQYGEFSKGPATKGYCDSECQWMVTFVVILSLGKLLSSTARVGNTIVTLRCVEPEDKSIALGALNGICSLLAFIPYPLIYGALTDASCIVWEESCGKTGNCWIYDTDKFRFLLHGVSSMFVFLGLLTDVAVWILSPRLKNLYDEDDEAKSSDNDDAVVKDADIISNGGLLGVGKTGIQNGSVVSVSNEVESNATTTM